MESEKREQLRVIDFVFLGLVWAVVPLRLFVRRCIIHNMGKDDWLMAVLLFLYTGYIINVEVGLVLGYGIHRAELAEWQWHSALKVGDKLPNPKNSKMTRESADARAIHQSYYTGEMFYIVCTCLLKISFGFFLLRIATAPKVILTIKVLMIGTLSFSSVYFIMAIFQCRPVSAWWDDNPRSEERCWPSDLVTSMTFLASAVNCLADFSFALLPVLVVWPLSMSLTRKTLIVILMGMGAVGSSVTIVRATLVPGLLDGEDFLYTNLELAIWSTVEVGTGMIAASLACLRPLIQTLRHMWGGSGQGPSSRWWQLRANRRRQRTGRNFRPAAQDVTETGTWGYNTAINSASGGSGETRGRGSAGDARRRHGGETSWLQKVLQISAITTSSISTFTHRGREAHNDGTDNISLAENGVAVTATATATAVIDGDTRAALDRDPGVQSLPRISQEDSAVQIPTEDQDQGLYERVERTLSRTRSSSSIPPRGQHTGSD
ncbi:hypothetical protein PpBr36_02921 [Pyricularia pennisetigena]|uniref:hypothetical protein n=1 Tax=Pyricularia pennisetigena TaxID=1578925 RepID=UPI00114FDB25|nr:hypothetical protein PpBr36_02921 [Pyricularia pennisetigena]TLS30428.1 hypothetical protein PpBr36_02921 [Pyricularia pennisetigena]